MNALIVGTRKEPLLDLLPERYLLIDDGPLIDQVEIPARKSITVFDVSKHSFNPLKDMSYTRARDFITVLDAIFPEGESTLTRRNSNYVLLKALLEKPRRLSDLSYRQPGASKEGVQDASLRIGQLLLSPALSRVLDGPTNLSFKGTIHARLDRAALGDFDAFVLANLLISRYPGTVVIPDFGFYACAFHSALLRQGRLIAGINSFSEVEALRNQLLLVEQKAGSHCTAEDGQTLALYAGLTPGTNGFNDFVQSCID